MTIVEGKLLNKRCRRGSLRLDTLADYADFLLYVSFYMLDMALLDSLVNDGATSTPRLLKTSTLTPLIRE